MRLQIPNLAEALYESILANNDLMAPLLPSRGIFWPLTPAVVIQHSANYNPLAQIHASKNTYCSYVTPEDAQYDLIVPNLKKINASAVAQARKMKAKRLTQDAWEHAKEAGLKKIKLAENEIGFI